MDPHVITALLKFLMREREFKINDDIVEVAYRCASVTSGGEVNIEGVQALMTEISQLPAAQQATLLIVVNHLSEATSLFLNCFSRASGLGRIVIVQPSARKAALC